MPKRRTYRTILSEKMEKIGKIDNSIFIGQQIVYRGNPMSTTLDKVSKDKMIEVPVMEETQMGMSLGLSMTNRFVVTFYPRWDFLISASNQLLNHIDKFELMTGKKVHMIIRVGKGSDKPLDPGHQHKSNYFKQFSEMCKKIVMYDCDNHDDLESHYDFAIKNPGIYLINEYPEKYDEMENCYLNLISDENNPHHQEGNNIFFNRGWIDDLIKNMSFHNYKFVNEDKIRERTRENFFHFVRSNAHFTWLCERYGQLPLSNEIKNLVRENKNLYVILYNAPESDYGNVIDVLEENLKKDNLNSEQFFICNANESLPLIKTKKNSKINVYVTNYLLSNSIRTIRHCQPQSMIGSEYDYKNNTPLDKPYLFSCYNRRIEDQSHRLSILCYLKKYGLLEDTNWSLLKGNTISKWLEVKPEYFKGCLDKNEFIEEIDYIKSFGIKEADYELNLKLDSDVDNSFEFCKGYTNNSFQYSYINITTESKFLDNDVIFITEKSLNPFAFLQIPIFVSTPYHVKKLRENYNLDMFDDFIDHSYDEIENSLERMNRIVSELRRLHSIKEEVKKFYRDNLDRLINNREKLFEIAKDQKNINWLYDLIDTNHQIY